MDVKLGSLHKGENRLRMFENRVLGRISRHSMTHSYLDLEPAKNSGA
jgi:hypothetical protein